MKRIYNIITSLMLFSILGIFSASNIYSAAPTTQARNLSFSNITSTNATISWINGNGTGRLVVVFPNTTDVATIDAVISDGTTYTGDANYTTGTVISTGYAVYRAGGSTRSVSVTNLAIGTTYNVKIYEYLIDGSTDPEYLESSANNNPRSFTTLTPTIEPPTNTVVNGSSWSSGWNSIWSHSTTPSVDGYEIQIGDNSNPIKILSDWNNVDIGYIDDYTVTDMTAGTTYKWRLRSYDGTIYSAYSSWVTVTTATDNTPPTILSIFTSTEKEDVLTNASSITYTVTFSEAMNSSTVNNGDFQCTGGGTITGVSQVNSSTYNVTVSTTITTATYTLTLVNATDIDDVAGNNITNYSAGYSQSYKVDREAPTVTSIVRTGGADALTNGTTVSYTVTFNELMSPTSVTTADFAVGTAGSVSLVNVGGTNDVYTVVCSTAVSTYTSTLSLSSSPAHNVTDVAGNQLTNATPTGTNQTFAVDREAPTNNLASITDLTIQASGSVVSTILNADVTATEYMNIAKRSAGNLAYIRVNVNSPSDASMLGGTFKVQYRIADDSWTTLQTSVSADRSFNITDETAANYDITVAATDNLGVSLLADNSDNGVIYSFRVTYTDAAGNPHASDNNTSGETVVKDNVPPAAMNISLLEARDDNNSLGNFTFGNIGNVGFASYFNNFSDRILVNSIYADEVGGQCFLQVTFNADATTPTWIETNPPTSIDNTNRTISFAQVRNTHALNNLRGPDLADGEKINARYRVLDAAGNETIGNDYATYDVTVDLSNPTISSIKTTSDENALLTNSTTVTYNVAFSEPMSDASIAFTDFSVGTAGSVASESTSNNTLYSVVCSTAVSTYSSTLSATGEIKDAAGNQLTVPTNGTTNQTYAVDRSAPTVSSIVRASGSTNPTNANNLNFTVTFSEPVTGVETGDFAKTGTALGTVNTVTAVSTSIYTVNVNSVSGIGTLGLNFTGLVDDIIGNVHNGDDFTTGEVFTMDNTPPTLTSIVRTGGADELTNGTTVSYTVTFNELMDPTSVTTADFAVGTAGSVSSVNVGGTNDVYTVVCSTAVSTYTSTLSLSSSPAHNVTDVAGNQLTNATPTGLVETYSIERTAPTVSSIVRASGSTNPTNANNVNFTVTFSEPVTGVETGDFTKTGTASGTVNSVTAVSTSVYTVNVNSVSGSGTLGLNFTGLVNDIIGNEHNGDDFTTGQTFTIDNTAPIATNLTISTANTSNDAYVWGTAFNGAIGNGNNSSIVSTETILSGGHKWIAIEAGHEHTLAIREDGTLWAWGKNNFGQLGDGSTTDRNVPTQIGTDTWIEISAELNNSYGIKTNGTLWGWGYNVEGHVGNNTTGANVTSPTQIGSASNWTKVDGSAAAVFVINSLNQLWGWAPGGALYIGTPGAGVTIAPIQIGGNTSDWAEVQSYLWHTLALKTNGTLWSWGENTAGRTGLGTATGGTSVPTQIGSDTWIKIAAGGHHSTGIKSNGTLWGWGPNNVGQLGDGTNTNRLSPTQTGTASNWTKIGNGHNHSFAINSNGDLFAFGWNANRQLGDGTTMDRNTPVLIDDTKDWASANGGTLHSVGLIAGSGPIIISDVTVAMTNDVTVSVTFDEAMDLATDPTITFNPSMTGKLTFASDSWNSANTLYSAIYNATDNNETINDIDVTVTLGRDALGNVMSSTPFNDKFNIETQNPTVSSIVRESGSTNPTKATNVNFTVTFSEPVTGVTIGDFTRTVTNTASGTVNTVTPVSTSVYTVNVNSVAGSGDLGLNFTGSVNDLVGNVGNTLYNIGEKFTIDNTPPTVTSASLNGTSTADWVALGSNGVSPGNVEYTRIALDNNDVLYAGYDDQTNGNAISVRKYNNGNWDLVGAQAITANNSRLAQILVGSDGNPIIVYAESYYFDYGKMQKFNGTSWANYGATFSMTPAQFMSATISADNDIYVAYRDEGVSQKITSKKFDGTNWTTVGSASFSSANAFHPEIALDNNEVPYVAYRDGSRILQVEKFNGYDWENVGSTNLGISEVQDLAIDNNNVPYVIYSDYINGYKAKVIKFNGNDWENVGSSAHVSLGSAQRLSIKFDNNNDPIIVYRDDHASLGGKAVAKRFDGTNWVTLGTSGFSAGSVNSSPDIAISSNNGIYAGFEDVGVSGKMVVEKYDTSLETIAESNVGTSTVNLNLTFSEPMKTSVAPVITFSPTVTSTLTFNSGSWTNNQNYNAVYNVADANVTTNDIDVVVNDAEDVLGNEMLQDTESDVFNIDTEAPTVSSIERASGSTNPTIANNVNFTVTFSEPVTGVVVGDFAKTGTASGTVNSVTAVSTSVYTVNVNSISGNGTLGLNFTGLVNDIVGNVHNGDDFTTVQTFTIDNTAPIATTLTVTTANVNNELYAWGDNFFGQLGDNTIIDKNTPIEIGSENIWIKIVGGLYHTLAIKEDGTLWAWGRNNVRQLGDGTNINKNAPTQISTDNTWTDISAGHYSSYGIKSGTLWGWGYNFFGQLGDGTNTNRNVPVQIGTDNNWKKIDGSYGTSVGLKTDGTLWAWGLNDFGQLGDGTNINKNAPVRIGEDDTWTDIQCDYQHTIGLKTDGSLWAWGRNNVGQLGDGTNANSNVPVRVGSDTWKSISVAAYHSLAIKTDGSLWSWGRNNSGQLGDATNTDSNEPTRIGVVNNWTKVEVGDTHSLALNANGDLFAWGNNANGQLGDGTNTNSNLPKQIGADKKWSHINGGGFHTLALVGATISDATVAMTNDVTVSVTFDEAMDNTQDPTLTFNPSMTGKLTFASDSWNSTNTVYSAIYNATDNNETINDIDVTVTLGRDALGNVMSSTPFNDKFNIDTQNPTVSSIERASGSTNPTNANNVNFTVTFSEPVTGVVVGDFTKTGTASGTVNSVTAVSTSVYTVNVNSVSGNGTLGLNFTGLVNDIVGNEHNGDDFTTGQTFTIDNTAPIATNVTVTTADVTNNAYTWGLNDFGQLGDNTTNNTNIPIELGSENNWTKIVAGDHHTLGLKTDGTLWSWGRNNVGQLGDGSDTDRMELAQIGTDNNWTDIAAGNFSSFGIKSGTLWAWGRNDVGQLGDGSNNNRNVPVQIGTDNNWKKIDGSASTALALKTDGTLWAWGLNDFGQLGNGTTTNSNVPLQVGNSTNDWADIQCDFIHTIGLKTDGTLWAWGRNIYGQLGDGTNTNRNTPVRVGLDTWKSISTGAFHSSGIKTDGSLWSWGGNLYGELGDGTNTNRNAPVRVGTENNWSKVALSQGGFYSLGLKTDGTLWSWGDNQFGQLGNGNNTNRNTPVRVGSDKKWSNIYAGESHVMALIGATISDATVAMTNDVTVSVTFNEAMDVATDPTITFNPDMTGKLTFASDSWNSTNTIYSAIYNATDNNETINDIDVTVALGKDLAGNVMSSTPFDDKFSIDTQNPIAPTPTIVSTCGNIVSGYYNTSNNGVSISFTLPNDASLNGGNYTLQIFDDANDSWNNVTTPDHHEVAITATPNGSTSTTITLTDSQLNAINGASQTGGLVGDDNDGNNLRVRVILVDIATNTNTGSQSNALLVDETLPTLEVTTPEGCFSPNNAFDIEVSVDDEAYTSNTARYAGNIGGQALTFNSISGTGTSRTLNVILTDGGLLTTGLHDLVITLTDEAGNSTTDTQTGDDRITYSTGEDPTVKLVASVAVADYPLSTPFANVSTLTTGAVCNVTGSDFVFKYIVSADEDDAETVVVKKNGFLLTLNTDYTISTTTNTITLLNASIIDGDVFTVELSGTFACGTVTSGNLTVTVNPLPAAATFTRTGTSGTVCYNDNSGVILTIDQAVTDKSTFDNYTYEISSNGGAYEDIPENARFVLSGDKNEVLTITNIGTDFPTCSTFTIRVTKTITSSGCIITSVSDAILVNAQLLAMNNSITTYGGSTTPGRKNTVSTAYTITAPSQGTPTSYEWRVVNGSNTELSSSEVSLTKNPGTTSLTNNIQFLEIAYGTYYVQVRAINSCQTGVTAPAWPDAGQGRPINITATQSSGMTVTSSGVEEITVQWTNGNYDGSILLSTQSSSTTNMNGTITTSSSTFVTEIAAKTVNSTWNDGDNDDGTSDANASNIIRYGGSAPAGSTLSTLSIPLTNDNTTKYLYDQFDKSSGSIINVKVPVPGQSGSSNRRRYVFRVVDFEGGSNKAARTYKLDGTNVTGNALTQRKLGVDGETEIDGENTISAISPNPAKDFIAFDMNLVESTNVTITIYSMEGREVLRFADGKMFGAGLHNINIPLKDFITGAYGISISFGGEAIFETFMVTP